MRLAVLADVHSNLPALQAVLADVDRIGPDGIWVAGPPQLVLAHTPPSMVNRFRSGLVVKLGSVGRPRDGSQRAAWDVLDLPHRTFEVRRVGYDIDAVASEIRKAGFPHELANRLY